MEDPYSQSRVMMSPIIGLMWVEMSMRYLVVDMGVIVNLDPTGSIDGPEADSDQEKPDKKLGPHRPGIDVGKASQEKPHASNDDHSDAVPQSPKPTDSTGLRRILHRDRGQGGQMINSGKHVKDASGESGEDWNHPGAP
jgi:hypothetical protein